MFVRSCLVSGQLSGLLLVREYLPGRPSFLVTGIALTFTDRSKRLVLIGNICVSLVLNMGAALNRLIVALIRTF